MVCTTYKNGALGDGLWICLNRICLNDLYRWFLGILKELRKNGHLGWIFGVTILIHTTHTQMSMRRSLCTKLAQDRDYFNELWSQAIVPISMVMAMDFPIIFRWSSHSDTIGSGFSMHEDSTPSSIDRWFRLINHNGSMTQYPILGASHVVSSTGLPLQQCLAATHPARRLRVGLLRGGVCDRDQLVDWTGPRGATRRPRGKPGETGLEWWRILPLEIVLREGESWCFFVFRVLLVPVNPGWRPHFWM